MPEQNNIFLTWENLAFSLPLLLVVGVYVSRLERRADSREEQDCAVHWWRPCPMLDDSRRQTATAKQLPEIQSSSCVPRTSFLYSLTSRAAPYSFSFVNGFVSAGAVLLPQNEKLVFLYVPHYITAIAAVALFVMYQIRQQVIARKCSVSPVVLSDYYVPSATEGSSSRRRFRPPNLLLFHTSSSFRRIFDPMQRRVHRKGEEAAKRGREDDRRPRKQHRGRRR